MAVETVLGTMATGQVTDGSQFEIAVPAKVFRIRSSFPQLWVQGLDTTKKAYLWKKVNDIWEPVEKDGAQVEFSITQRHYSLTGPSDAKTPYGLTKDLTAGVLTIVLHG